MLPETFALGTFSSPLGKVGSEEQIKAFALVGAGNCPTCPLTLGSSTGGATRSETSEPNDLIRPSNWLT
jgi:hypothetical protein